MKHNSLITVGDRIRVARKLHGWSQEELANRSGLDRSYVGGIERGERNITLLTLFEICFALNCDPEAILQGLPPSRTSELGLK